MGISTLLSEPLFSLSSLGFSSVGTARSAALLSHITAAPPLRRTHAHTALHCVSGATSGVFMSLFYQIGEYPDDRSDGWERAVVQLLEPVWGELSLQARSLQPEWRDLFHVRTRVRYQSFMSSRLGQTEDTKNCQSKTFLSY